MESSYQQTARDTIINGIANFLIILVGLVQLPLLTKNLGAHDYGLWSQVNVTVSLILPFAGLGLVAAMVRFLAAEKKREEIQEGFYSVVVAQLLLGSVIALAVLLLASPLAMSFFDGAVQLVRITAAIILVATLEPVYLRLLMVFRQIKTHSLFLIADSCGRIGLIACLVLTGHGILSVILSLLAVRAVIIVILFFLIKSQIGIKRPNFSRIREYLSFSLPTVPRGIGTWLVNLSDRYVIAYFLRITQVGVYSAAYGLGSVPHIISGLLNFIMLVAMSKLYDEGRMNEVKTHLSYSIKYFLAIVIPFIFGAAILAEPVLRMFSTSEIAVQGRSIIPIIALGFLFLGAHTALSRILLLVKKPIILAYIWIVLAALNLGLNILMVPLLGIIGAAITTLITYFLAMCAVIYFSLKEFTFSIDWRFIIKSLLASMIMSLVVWLMAPQGTVYTLLTVATGVVVYGTAIILLRGFSKTEFEFFKGLLRRGTGGAYPADETSE